ncbi:thioesterase family protein [Flavobacterium sp. MC2016-06]|jgi:acyl-CoA thioester hydrolase|uniref:acyl-CoA thioesterase n=1 Tax=Flavobacterium sp. MC2016-06 TaxID=2676308 RepID=UPI0012BA5AB6|nr:thioesterase family protein [Flavobacterium sp. MC2016-06]MBU3857762.1 thioesterase family protein [Flavobacterium sp. MC2016-06]
MEYSKNYTVADGHIDVQGIMDGLYYPFYMEECRHDFIREILGFDFVEQAENGVFMVLSEYSIKFIRSLKKDDNFDVTCAVFTDPLNLPRLHFKQTIIKNGKVMASAVFTGTCIPASGGRPYLPEELIGNLFNAPTLNI